MHRRPELSEQETGTIRILQEFLCEQTSFAVVDRDGWFYAVKRGNSDESPIAFRADMDALPMQEDTELPYRSEIPSIAHKCGHDGHMAVLCGLALELDGLELPQTVYLIFQPAEEIGQGGERCAALIREKGIREIYAFHNLSGYPENCVVYRRGLSQPASEGIQFTLTGWLSHASEPENGLNPASVIARIVLSAQELAGSHVSQGMAMCTLVGMNCGNGDFGISPGEGTVSFTLRAKDESVLKAMEQALIRKTKELAAETGLQLQYEIRDPFPETRNHEQCVDRVVHQAEQLGLRTLEMKELMRGSEDFGYYLKACPGAIFYIGNGETYPALHTADYDFNDRILGSAVDMFAGLAGRWSSRQ